MQFQEITTGNSKEMPNKIIAYGVPKIGKSRFAAQFPDPFFIDVEGGLQYIGKEVRSTPKLQNFDDVIAWLVHIHGNEDFKAGRLVIDSLDWCEELARAKIEKAHDGKSIKDNAYKPFSYGAGQAMVDTEVMRLFKALDMIWEAKKIPALIIAHSQVRTMDLPNKDPYSKYELKTSKAVAAKAAEWADIVLFADYSFHVSEKTGKPSEPRPMLLAGGSAAFTGGSRMRLSKEIPLDYNELLKEVSK